MRADYIDCRRRRIYWRGLCPQTKLRATAMTTKLNPLRLLTGFEWQIIKPISSRILQSPTVYITIPPDSVLISYRIIPHHLIICPLSLTTPQLYSLSCCWTYPILSVVPSPYPFRNNTTQQCWGFTQSGRKSIFEQVVIHSSTDSGQQVFFLDWM